MRKTFPSCLAGVTMTMLMPFVAACGGSGNDDVTLPGASGSGTGTASRPLLSATAAANETLLKTLAAGGPIEALVTDNWNPAASGIGNVASFTPTYTVAASGGTHTTVQAAIDDAAASASTSRVYIRVMPGTYREQVCVKTTVPITLYSTSSDASQVVIVNNHYNSEPKASATVLNACEGRSGQATYGTSGSTTFLAYSDGFQAKNLTFANDTNEATITGTGTQAVALTTTGDKIIFENVRMLGHQDTFQPKSPNTGTVSRVYVANSYIEGDVDFVFGRAVTVFNGVTFKSLVNRVTSGYVFAPSHPELYAYGFLVMNSSFTTDTAAAGTLNLGRAWDDSSGSYTTAGGTRYLPNGRLVIRESAIGAHINRTDPWAGAASTNRPYSSTTPQTVTFGGTATTFPVNRLYEYLNTGAGAAP